MRNFVFPTAAAALIVSTLGAFATTADTMTTGVIKSIDLKTHTLVLEDGTSFGLPMTFKDASLKPGEKVIVGWQMVKNQHEADSVVLAK